MKVLSAEQIRMWDQYTIEHKPIDSIELMERAAYACVQWIEKNGLTEEPFMIFCGKGNNGGDGLAIARMLSARRYVVKVFILEFGHKGTEDFQANLAALHEYPEVEIRYIHSEEHFPVLEKNETIIDALFGSGLNRALEGVTAELVEHINRSGNLIISIDIPSGLFVDRSSKGNPVIKAGHTLSFQCYKPAFLVPENAASVGELDILDIGLDAGYYAQVLNKMELIDRELIRKIFKRRNPFAHKGNFGHALLIAGSHGKIGAAVLAAKACLRTGAGLTTCHIPGCGFDILQASVPEAMVITDGNHNMLTKLQTEPEKFTSIGIGPGIGTGKETKQFLEGLLKDCKQPVVLDADALNCLAGNEKLISIIPPNSILTPHPKEFERLFGPTENDFDRIQLAVTKAKQFNIIIVLKGHHTFITSKDEIMYFNSTGNPGMAKGGSGDVLTGMLTALLAQAYSPIASAILGVYLHGLAGDVAANKHSQEAMIASDIIDGLGDAFSFINN